MAALLFTAALLLGGCTIRETPLPAAEPGPLSTEALPAETPAASYTVRFESGGETLSEQSVEAGALPAPVTEPQGDAAFLGWANEAGESVDPWAVPVTGELRYEARLAPALYHDRPYMTAEGGLFRPEDALTRQEAAEIFYTLLEEKPEIPDPLPEEPSFDEGRIPDGALILREEEPGSEPSASPGPSASPKPIEAAGAVVEYNEELQSGADHIVASARVQAEGYGHLAALAAEGCMEADETGSLRPREAISREEFAALLGCFFPEDAVKAAALGEGESLSRLETAEIMNALLQREAESTEDSFYADIPQGDERLETIRAAAENGEKREPGYLLLSNGGLYWIGEDGCILRDQDVGRMHFGPDGLHTSGSEELDALVREIVGHVVDPAAGHEEQLRSVYNYVRDHFVYLRRNYYDVGEHGWEIEEATEFLDSHYGNCYSFAAGMWALARGVGYDANAISGLTGEQNAPHGWIDITLEDGVRYFFDVELEYAALRDGATLYPMFKLPWSGATVNWHYTYNWTVEGFPIY